MDAPDTGLADAVGEDSEHSVAGDHYRRQLETIAQNATLALFIMDEHQRCTYMNPAAERLTGFRFFEVQGKPLHDYVHHTRPDGSPYPLSECPIDQAFPQNMREQGEEVFVHPDGHFYPVAFTASPIRDGARTVGTIIEVRDITEEKNAEAALRESESRFRTMADTAPVLIWTANTAMLGDWFNRPWLEFTGRRLDQELGNGWAEGVHPDDVERCLHVYAASFAAREPFSMEYRLRRFDGEYRWVLDKGVPRFAPGGEFAGYIGCVVETHDLVVQREALAEANRAKSEFLAAMSHELRTPLNAIGGYTDLLVLGIHGPLTGEQRNALSRISTNQRLLLAQVQDILSFAKLEAGRVEFSLSPLRAREVLADLDPLIAPQAQTKGVTFLVTECEPDLHFLGDGERVRQILLNLLNNAVKFTPAGGWIAVECTGDAKRVTIRVRDNGPGIRAEMQNAIFEPFVQVDRRYDSPQEGIGLGLAISRELARAMDGDLTVESEPGAGSTFTLTLPGLQKPGL